jgi:signal peptidase II
LAGIAGGALGNLIDRLRLGRVVDFIDVDFFDIDLLGITRWWTFNVADIAISGAIVLLLLITLFQRRHDSLEPEVRSPGRV